MGLLSPIAGFLRRRSTKDKIRVVVADDEPQVRRALKRLLERDGRFLWVGEAADGAEAAATAAAQHPDAVILDLAMPGTDGLAAIPAILKAAPDCKIVVLSSMTPFNENREKALQLGASEALNKYSSPRTLLSSLAEAVARET